MLRKSTCVILLFLACFLLYSCGKSEAVISVEEQISQIGSIDEFSKITTDSIETQYEALSDSEKKKVENYADLQEAQKEYDNLIASKVVARIDEIGEVTKDSYPKIKMPLSLTTSYLMNRNSMSLTMMSLNQPKQNIILC